MIDKKWMIMGAVIGALIVIYALFFNKQGVNDPGNLASANRM